MSPGTTLGEARTTDPFQFAQGQVPGVYLFWTPIDLATTAGVRGFDPNAPIGPITAGFHLFQATAGTFQELPLDSVLTMGTEIHD